MKAVTSAQMRNIDKSATEIGQIPSIVLMENAAISFVNELLKTKKIETAAIFCGKGNNAGDGFAIARHLYNRGIDVRVYLLCGSECSPDAQINLEIISKMGIKITELSKMTLSDLEIRSFDVIIDAIFGTGLNGEISGVIFDAIDMINNNARFIASVDVPSGINSDDGNILGISVNADLTLTFLAYKIGMTLFPAADCVGDVRVLDISIPDYIVDINKINTNIIDEKFAKNILPRRIKNSHKGDYGKVLIIGGAKGMTGAVTLCANACLRTGAGLVTVAVSEELNSILEEKLTEAMTLPLPSENGILTEDAKEILCKKINDFDVCVIGPGMGRANYVEEILQSILKVSKIPVVLDADALYALSKNPAILEECSCNLVLTPHEAEMSRLYGCDIQTISKNRLKVSLDYSTNNGVTLLLKGPYTIVTTPSGVQYININGNSGMATGGSGDVLSGIIGAFLARGLDEEFAASLGAFIHARAGDFAAITLGKDSMIASDIITNIPNALNLPLD